MKQYIRAVLAIAMAVGLMGGTAGAADLTWDANNTGAGVTDGAGTWLNANQWWTGAANATWNNTTPDNAKIGNGGAGGSITLGTVTAGSVTVTNFSGTYTLTGGSLAQSLGITVYTDSGDVVNLQSPVSGAGGVTMNGPGNMNFRTGLKTFTGPFTINGGGGAD